MTGRTPPLQAVHEDAGASFTDFGGWEMPVEFDSIRTEHAAVRESVGIFDVSHMGEIEVTGPDARELMQRLTTNDVPALDSGEAQYAMITDEDGIILDDTVVYNLPPEHDADYLFIPNAGHDGQMYDRWVDHRDEWGLDAEVSNRTDDYAMFALQGPDAEERLLDAVAEDQRTTICGLNRFGVVPATVGGVDCLVARTGYTGEDGFELIAPADEADTVWEQFDCQPCGLGARDTLRIEMGFLLSGQDFDPEDDPRNPYEAGVGFTVKLDTEFVGRDALERVDAEGVAERLTGFRLVDRGVPRQGYTVRDLDGEAIGTVTSGTMSPTLEKPIGLAYLPVEYRSPGVNVQVMVRGEPKKAQTQALPFLDR
ncbi:glycine cleavage system protein T [Halorientalis sp. IM1011]|uniref:glycine cleavage system aminomethyltransferase GcvT n=1 Tax=Halorientalis sp. IM1011 TaxID=1932360 RepID=UPI00097CD3E3|nr:glycine cleavage system aminomethyltransferase GcvT [Halorientalis sp. IM1011]AQL43764.1 glycine cleavage system protein T [Halorientalis sp. IM1011]